MPVTLAVDAMGGDHGPSVTVPASAGFLDASGGGGWGPVVTSTLIGSGHAPRQTVGSVNTTEFFVTLAAATGMVARVSFDRERMREAASDELIAATDVADLLVRLGTPFREAHGVVAGLVRTALDSGRTLSQLTPEELAAQSETLAEHAGEYRDVLSQSAWLESKISEGGTSLRRVEQQLALARSVVDEAPAA